MNRFKNRKSFYLLAVLFFADIIFQLYVDMFTGSAYEASGPDRHYGVAHYINIGVSFTIIAVVVFENAFYLYKRKRESRKLLRLLAFQDSSWDQLDIRRRIEVVFSKVQEAWAERDQDIAHDYMSNALYLRHISTTNLMKATGRMRIVSDIKLTRADIVCIGDFEDDSMDFIWAYMRGGLVNHIIDDDNKDFGGKEGICELWRFIRGKNGWVVDEIKDNVTSELVAELKGMRSFSEEFRP